MTVHANPASRVRIALVAALFKPPANVHRSTRLGSLSMAGSDHSWLSGSSRPSAARRAST